jgi:hypothetical protein
MPGGFGGGFGFPLPLGGFGGGYSGGGYASGGYASAPVAAPAVAQATLPAVAQTTGSVDLVVEDIHMVQPATLVAGPAYQVTFRNQGSLSAGHFRVGIFAALDGKGADDAKAVVDVQELAAGQSAAVTLRLPAASLRLVNVSTGQPTAFNQLLIAVDPDGAVVETDKANNVAVLDRAAIEAR